MPKFQPNSDVDRPFTDIICSQVFNITITPTVEISVPAIRGGAKPILEENKFEILRRESNIWKNNTNFYPQHVKLSQYLVSV